MSKLFVEPSPHIRSGWTTQKIMLNVIIALLTAYAARHDIFNNAGAMQRMSDVIPDTEQDNSSLQISNLIIHNLLNFCKDINKFSL